MAAAGGAPVRAIVAAGLNSSSTLQCFDVRPDDGTLLPLGEVVHAGMQTMYAAASPELPIVYVVDINGVKDPVQPVAAHCIVSRARGSHHHEEKAGAWGVLESS
jgi:hypothetical protein